MTKSEKHGIIDLIVILVMLAVLWNGGEALMLGLGRIMVALLVVFAIFKARS